MKTKYFGNKSGENNILIEELECDGEEINKGYADCTRQMSCLDAGVSEKREYEQIKICEISDKRNEDENSRSGKETKVCSKRARRKYYRREKLKDRSDVVNKSLLRAIKKYFVNIFKEEFPQSRFRSSSKCARQFYDSIHALVQALDSDLDSSHLVQIFGGFINNKLFDRCCKIFNFEKDEKKLCIFWMNIQNVETHTHTYPSKD